MIVCVAKKADALRRREAAERAELLVLRGHRERQRRVQRW